MLENHSNQIKFVAVLSTNSNLDCATYGLQQHLVKVLPSRSLSSSEQILLDLLWHGTSTFEVVFGNHGYVIHARGEKGHADCVVL